MLALRECGVDRISVNPQTMQQKTLDLIGRRHTVDQTIQAFELARKLGFTNINMDLIIGLPGEELSDFEDTLRQVGQLAPDSLTIHSLVIKRASRLRSVLEEQGALGETEQIRCWLAGSSLPENRDICRIICTAKRILPVMPEVVARKILDMQNRGANVCITF